jgi:hypothetical protein
LVVVLGGVNILLAEGGILVVEVRVVVLEVGNRESYGDPEGLRVSIAL